MERRKYDLVVIGSGPAGEKGAAQAAYFGKKVALVEREPFLGGTASSNTVPSKTLRETALALSGFNSRRLHGVDLSLHRQATVRDFLYHEESVKEAERARVAYNLDRHNVDVCVGHGSFVDGRTVKVETNGQVAALLEGDIILIATGSSPRRPEGFPEGPCTYDSDTIPQLRRIPRNIVVVGGGVVGCEYACTFAALGVRVFFIHGSDTLLPFLDREISLALRKSMQAMGIELLMPSKAELHSDEEFGVAIKLDSGRILETEALLLATGRVSNTRELSLASAGITAGTHGVLAVDGNFQVVHPETRAPVPRIYAAGDVIGAPALASTAMEQARFAMIRAFDLEPYKQRLAPIFPMAIYTIPECSKAGKTEEDCKREGVDYVAGRAWYSQNARGMIVGGETGFLKLFFEMNDDLLQPMKLLGVHIIGEMASELVHIGVNALMMGAGNDLFIDTCFNYPTLGELYKYATYDAMGNRRKTPR
ncbi:MAG: FAD-dependent oxidoreductase [Chloroflexi bacterium]|nr:FAD-dependent oxidoreductase [Chloroflexota bacterium]